MKNPALITFLVTMVSFLIVPAYAGKLNATKLYTTALDTSDLDDSELDNCEFEINKLNKADLKAKSERIRSALMIAHEYARTALMNPRYMRVIRPSAISGGPADIRQILQRFLNEISDDPMQSRIVFDGSKHSSAVCNKNPWGAVIIGDSKIYICNKGLSLPDRMLAEVIIHEFVHSIGYQTALGECQASEVSMSAIIASGRSPYGDTYTNSELCKNMTDSQRALALEIWPKEESASNIKVGTKITFMSDILSRIQTNAKNKYGFNMKQASGNIFDFSEIGNKGSIPKEPFIVKENLSNSQFVLILEDANSNFFRFVISTKSQVPIPLSFLKSFGISIQP